MTTASAAALPARKIATSPQRRISTVVLIIGTALSLVAAVGPLWIARLGVVVAVAAAVTACTAAWSELRLARREHAAAMAAASRAHVEALRTERRHNASVLDVLTGRSQLALAEVERQNTVIARLRSDVSSLRGDAAALRWEIGRRESVIAGLRETVRAREAELAALHGDAADVRVMPRRVRVDSSYDEPGSGAGDGPGAGDGGGERETLTQDRWSDSTHPTVVDLAPIDTSIVLPNFEADRRPA